MTRWLRFIGAAAIATGLATADASPVAPEPPPPPSGAASDGNFLILPISDLMPELQSLAEKQLVEMRDLGYLSSEESLAVNVEDIRASLSEHENDAAALSFEPAELVIPQATQIGVLAGQPVDGRYASATQVFVASNGDYFVLEEVDLNMSNETIVLVKDFVNTEVNGIPAVYTLAKDSGNNRAATLSWRSNARALKLILRGKSKDDDPRAILSGLAASILVSDK